MPRFSDVDVFLTVAEAGSFRGAATSLDVTRSTVSRAVARLEQHLGTPLILRDTSSTRLTEAGQAYRRWAHRAASALREAERAARAVTAQIEGRLRVSAPPALGPGILTPMFTAFLAEHSRISIELVLTDRMVNPILEDIDVAVRLGDRLADSDLRSRKLADLDMLAVATPECAARLGPGGPVPAVLFVRPDGASWTYDPPVPLQARLQANDYLSIVSAVLRGVGVGVVSRLLVREHLERGRLVQVLPSWRLPVGRVWGVYPGRGRPPAGVRALIDTLVEGFAISEGTRE